MYEFPTILFRHPGDLLQPGNRYPATGYPQSDGEEIFTALLDEAAGLEVVQINLCLFSIGHLHDSK